MKLKASTILLLALLLPILLGAEVRVKRVGQSDAESGQGVLPTSQTISIDSAQAIQTSAPVLPGVSQAVFPAASSVAASNYAIDWYSFNGGGAIDAASPNYKLGSSAGQSAAGAAASANYQMGIGFWYGAGGGCSCPKQGDINADAVIDVFDVIGIIGVAFSGDPDPQDPACPKTRGDVNNDGVTDVFDVIYLIATAFSGGPEPVNPCGP